MRIPSNLSSHFHPAIATTLPGIKHAVYCRTWHWKSRKSLPLAIHQFSHATENSVNHFPQIAFVGVELVMGVQFILQLSERGINCKWIPRWPKPSQNHHRHYERKMKERFDSKTLSLRNSLGLKWSWLCFFHRLFLDHAWTWIASEESWPI